MSKQAKVWLAAATALVVLGLLLFAAAMMAAGWDFTKLSTEQYETNEYQIDEAFSDISMKTDTADILFVTADDGKCRVVCREQKTEKHSVTVTDNTLTIQAIDSRKWYESIGITIGAPTITIYLPETEYGTLSVAESTGDIEIPGEFKFESIDILTSTGDVNNRASAKEYVAIQTDTGYINVENISAKMLELVVSTGDVTVSDVISEGDVTIRVSTGKTNVTGVRCNDVISTGNTGDIFLQDVIAAETVSIERSTGDVAFEDCDAAELFVETDTGSVTGSFLTEKVFLTQTNTGDVDVPKTMTGGKCEITTSTGDIKLDIR